MKYIERINKFVKMIENIIRYDIKNPLSDTPKFWKETAILEKTAEKIRTPANSAISSLDEKISSNVTWKIHSPIFLAASANFKDRIYSKITEKSGYFLSSSCSSCLENVVISISSSVVCAATANDGIPKRKRKQKRQHIHCA